MKRMISKTLVFVLMLAVVFTMMPNTIQKAYADSGDPAMVIGSSVLAKNVNKDGLQKVWLGRYLEPKTKKRMWYVIGYDGQGSNPASREGLITILHKNIPSFSGGERFSGNSNVSYANQYSVANIRWIVNSYYNGDGDWKWNNSKEKGIIVKRTLEGGGSNYGEKGYDENKIKGNPVEDAGFWLLSCGEAEALPGGIRHLYNDNSWWLRSPGQYDGKVAYCWTDYNYDFTAVIRDGVSTDTYHGVRPACDLDMNAILFTSAAEGGKVSGSGADALTKVGNNKNSEWKLTIRDADRRNFAITTCSDSYDSASGMVTFRYSGAKAESNSFISAIIVGSDDSIKYYGRIAEASKEGGQVAVNTSGKMESGDKLYVFNEQYNGDKTSDYASDLKELALPTTGSHKWAAATCTDPKTCEICGKTEGKALPHDYKVIAGTAVEPSCTNVGKEADQKCSLCGDVIEGKALPALGHEWVVDGTTDKDGWRSWTTGDRVHQERRCNRCEFAERREYEQDHEHSRAPMSKDDGTPATCTADGVRAHYVCTCGGWFENSGAGAGSEPKPQEDFVIKATGHEWNAADCEHPKTCKICGEKEGSNLGHSRKFTGWTWIGNEERGYSEAVAGYICIREGCGDIINRRITPTTRVVQPGCTSGGWTEYRVEIASVNAPDLTTRSNQKEAKFTDPKGHDYQEVKNTAVAATCTEPGKEADQKCSRCDAVIDGTVIPALGHDWGEWTVTRQATETAEGVETRVCKNDPSHKEERSIPRSDHKHNLSSVAPKNATCTEAGNIGYYICNKGDHPCGKCFSDKDGKKEIDKESTVMYPTGHTVGTPVRENETAATCTADGEFDEVVYCAECGTEIRRTHRAAAALGHDWDEWTVTKRSTETEEGVETRVCKNDPSHKETKSIPKLTPSEQYVIDIISSLPDDPAKANADDVANAVEAYKALPDTAKGSISSSELDKLQAAVDYPAAAIKAKISSVKAVKGRKAVIKWKKSNGADGYQLSYKAKGIKAKQINISNAGTLRKTVKKLKAGKKYAFRIRTYTKVENLSDGAIKKVYGKWSNVKKIKAKR